MKEYYIVRDNKYLEHHGIKGQKWGVRRYQNEDGTLTEEGKKRYGDQTPTDENKSFEKDLKEVSKKMAKYFNKSEKWSFISYKKSILEYDKALDIGQKTVDKYLDKNLNYEAFPFLKEIEWYDYIDGKTIYKYKY